MQGRDARALLRCLLVAGVIGVVLVSAPVLVARAVGAMPAATAKLPARLGIGARDFLSFVPVVFILEEVAFRGLLDAWVHPNRHERGIGSAIFVSALWGLWHLPVVRRFPSPGTAAVLVVVHVAIGVPLTVFWRRSGNLAVPGVVHAFIDGVRDAVLMA
jgi:membrane protease YdiL (CAAX protease family)